MVVGLYLVIGLVGMCLLDCIVNEGWLKVVLFVEMEDVWVKIVCLVFGEVIVVFCDGNKIFVVLNVCCY